VALVIRLAAMRPIIASEQAAQGMRIAAKILILRSDMVVNWSNKGENRHGWRFGDVLKSQSTNKLYVDYAT
jgi:hypothetical protein